MGDATRGAQRSVRSAKPDDLPFLTLMLVEAANWDGARVITRLTISQDPHAWQYLDGWQRASDFGVVVLDDASAVGAAWARVLPEGSPGYGFVSAEIPELTLAVARESRGTGVGSVALAGLIAAARALNLPALSLSVEDGNLPARTLYERAGFVVVGRNGNSDTMLLRLSA